MDVGKQLKTIRTMRGLSQRELAKRSGVTNSMISQIEQNLVNPSVGSLKKILDAIPISMGEFFTLDVEPKDEIFFTADQMADLGDGKIKMLLVGAKREGRDLAILREIYPQAPTPVPTSCSMKERKAASSFAEKSKLPWAVKSVSSKPAIPTTSKPESRTVFVIEVKLSVS